MVYSLTTLGTVIIKEALPAETPIIFSIVIYPVDSGLSEAFDYSGNNLVGASNFIQLHHYVGLLTLALPQAKTLAIFHRKSEPNYKIRVANLIKGQGINVLDFDPS